MHATGNNVRTVVVPNCVAAIAWLGPDVCVRTFDGKNGSMRFPLSLGLFVTMRMGAFGTLAIS